MRRGIALLIFFACGAAVFAQEKAVVDSSTPWRAWHTLAPPVVQLASGVKPILTGKPHLDRETACPPGNWNQVDFDDSGWLRTVLPTQCRTPYLCRQYLRASFFVTDLSQVSVMRLSLAFRGGVVVYLNGKEVARAFAGKADTLAQPYAEDAFVNSGGEFLRPARDDAGSADLPQNRFLADVAVPPGYLQKGKNVLAVEVVRAPYHRVIEEKKGSGVDSRELEVRGSPYDIPWNTCEALSVRLSCRADAKGIVPPSRPSGLSAIAADIVARDSPEVYPLPWEPAEKVTITGAKGGRFSGKLLVSCPEKIEGLRVSAESLKAEGGAVIPASHIRIRYAVASDPIARYGAQPPGYDTLLDAPPASVPGGRLGVAVIPVWMTVNVPKSAAAGEYSGALKLEAQGQPFLSVPVLLKVADWTLPEPQDYRTWVELIQSPDTLAVEYNVPLWSERHWELIGKSLRFLGEIGSKTVYIPLICHTNFGNEQSMVRWVRAKDGTYTYDFSVMDRYLDLAEREMGRPRIVCFNVWDIYLNQPESAPSAGIYQDQYSARFALKGKGPAVTVVDPGTGSETVVYLPRYEEKESRRLWKPLFDELFRKMEARGLRDAMALGMFWEKWPNKEEVAFFSEVAPGLGWVNVSHLAKAADLYSVGKIAYWMKAFGLEYNGNPAAGRTFGWKRKDLVAEYHRFGYWNVATLTTVRYDAEFNITGNQRGIGRVGADFWPVLKNSRGQRSATVVERFPQSKWHNWDIGSWLLAPGPDGPAATARFENVREGIQECEARIAIESALAEPAVRNRLGEKRCAQIQEELDRRLLDLWTGVSTLQLTGRSMDYATYNPPRNMTFTVSGGSAGEAWYLPDWRTRTGVLFSLAAEVSGAAGR